MEQEQLKTSDYPLGEIYFRDNAEASPPPNEQPSGVSGTTLILIVATAIVGSCWIYYRFQVKPPIISRSNNDSTNNGKNQPASTRQILTDVVQNNRLTKIESRLKDNERKVNELYNG